MTTLERLGLIDPLQALHDAWHTTSPVGVVTTGGLGFTGWLADINWSAGLTFVVLAGGLIFGLIVQCVKQWKQMAIDVAAYQRKVDEGRYAAQAKAYIATARAEGEGRRPLVTPAERVNGWVLNVLMYGVAAWLIWTIACLILEKLKQSCA